MDETNDNQKKGIVSACIDFLQNVNYDNQIVQFITMIMGFFFLLQILGMFKFNINLNQCP